jgi:hypothetical protein
MEPFTIHLPGGLKASVIQKREGRKRSVRLLFIRLRKSKKLIAYTLLTNNAPSITYTIYKTKNDGRWLKDVLKHDGRLTPEDEHLTVEMEKAIDEYEHTLGKEAYKQLF